MSEERKIIAVVGATGAQGGGLVKAILEDPRGGFAVRALTRDPGSEKARELARLGAEVVAADLDDEASLERAFAGAYGAYCVTFYWAHFSPEREIAQAAAMARAARKAGLRHVIWSTLEDARRFVPLDDPRMPTLHGRFKVPHTDAKGEADRFFLEAGVPTTFLLTSFYWENLIFFGMGPRRGKDGRLTLALPLADRKLAGVAAEDIGRTAYGIFKEGPALVGRTIGVAGEHLTGKEMAAALTRALWEEVVYHPIPVDEYRALGFPAADDLANMFQFKVEFNDVFLAARDPEVARRLHPGLQGFARWLRRHATRIPLAAPDTAARDRATIPA